MISSLLYAISYTADGVVVSFSFPYWFQSSSHLVVEVDGVQKTLGVDYVVSTAGPATGCTITFVTAPSSGTTVTLTRQTPKTQLVNYIANQNFPASTHEAALDKLTAIVQELAAQVAGLTMGNGGLYYVLPGGDPNGSIIASAPAECIELGGNNQRWRMDSLTDSTVWTKTAGF